MLHTAHDFAHAHVVGADSRQAAHFARRCLDDHAEACGLGASRFASEQKQTALNAVFTASLVSKMGFGDTQAGNKTPAASPQVASADTGIIQI